MNRLTGLTLAIGGLFLLFMAVGMKSMAAKSGDPLFLLFALVFFLPGVVFARRWMRRSRNYMLNRIEAALEKDRRAPILLLRSFEHDEQFMLRNSFFSPSNWLIGRGRLLEETICQELREYGPPIAVGKPEEIIPPIGAVRLYFADDKWRKAVDHLIGQSQFVVIVLGSTPGLVEEYSRVFLAGALSKTVFIVPPVPPEDLDGLIEPFRDFLASWDLHVATSFGSNIAMFHADADRVLHAHHSPGVRPRRRKGTVSVRHYDRPVRALLRSRARGRFTLEASGTVAAEPSGRFVLPEGAMSSPTTSESGRALDVAPLRRRWPAALIDVLFLYVAMLVPYTVIALLLGYKNILAPGEPTANGEENIVVLSMFLVVLILIFVFEGPWGDGLPGKRLMGLRVRSLDGHRLRTGQALLRAFFKTALWFVFIPGLLLSVGDYRRRALHDRTLKTVVLRRQRVRERQPNDGRVQAPQV